MHFAFSLFGSSVTPFPVVFYLVCIKMLAPAQERADSAPVFQVVAPVGSARERRVPVANRPSWKFHNASSRTPFESTSTPSAPAIDPLRLAYDGLSAHSAGLARQVQQLDGQVKAYADLVSNAQAKMNEMIARMAEQEAQRQMERAQLAEARRLIELQEERLRSQQGAAQSQSGKKPRGPPPKKWSDLGPRQLERRGKGIQGMVQKFRDQLQAELGPDMEVREIVLEPKSTRKPEGDTHQAVGSTTEATHNPAAGCRLSYKVEEGKVSLQRVRREAKRVQKKVNKEYYKKYGRLPQHSQVTPVQMRRIQRLLAAKDAGKLSDRQYARMAMADPGMERLHRLKKERAKQNGEIDVVEMEGAFDGHRRKISDLLTYILSMDEIRELYEGMDKPKLKLRLAIDGRKTSNSGVKSVMTVFSLLDEAAAGRNSQEHQYCVALYDGGEDYEEMKNSLVDVFEEVEELEKNGFTHNGRVYEFDYYLCCDWKMLANLMGLNQANSTFFCLWCDCTKAEIFDMSVEDWEISRTYDQCVERCTKRRHEDACGCKFSPLLNINFFRIIPDTLHMHLRIGGALIHGIIEWAVNNNKREELLAELAECGVRLNLSEVKEESGATKYTYPTLDGNNIKRVLQLIKLNFLPTDGNRREATRQCIAEFNKLMAGLAAEKTSGDYIEPDQFKEKAKKFIGLAREVFFDEDITPYMHTLVYHVPQFLQKYGTIYQFNCQAVEKKNHAQNCSFHRTTQHGGLGSSYTRQVLEEENRHLYQRRAGLLAELAPKRRVKHRRETEKSRAWKIKLQKKAEEKRKKLSERIAEQIKKRSKKRKVNGRKIKVKAL